MITKLNALLGISLGGTALKVFSLKIIGVLMNFVLTLIISRKYGAASLGDFAIIFMLLNIVIVFGKGGLDLAATKFVAKYNAEQQFGLVGQLMRKIPLLTFLFSAITAVVLFLMSPFVADFLDKPYLLDRIRIASIFVVPFALLVVIADIQKGLERLISFSFLKEMSIFLFSLIGLGFFIYFFDSSDHLEWIIFFGIAITAIIALVVNGYTLGRVKHKKIEVEATGFDFNRILKYGLAAFFVGSFDLINQYVGIVFLSIEYSSVEVGVWNVVQKLATFVVLPLFAINAIVAPKFSRASALGSRVVLRKLYMQTIKLSVIATTGVLLVLLPLRNFVLELFGTDFTTGGLALIIMLFSAFINALTGSSGVLLLMTGYERIMRNIVFLSLMVNVGASYLLVQDFGISGVAFASLVTATIVNVVCFLIIVFKVKLFHE